MARVTLRLPDELNTKVEEYVGYGSKSEFYRQSATEKLLREGAIENEAEVTLQDTNCDREPGEATTPN